MNIKVLMAGMTVVMAFAVVAMPSKAELNTAQKLVAELMESKVAEFKAKKISAEEIGDASMGYVKEAETEAVKFLLLKGAIGFYARGENYDKAADAFTMLKKSVKDIPPTVQEDILSKAANRISAKKAPKLFAMYKTVKVQVGAATVMKQLALQLNKSPNDFKLRRKYAEAVAASGDWDAAIKEFSKVEEPYGGYAKKEAAGKVNNAAQAEFWWAYEPLSDNYDDIFKMHAAQFYRNAIAGGEITGIKKNIVAKRLASIGEDLGWEFSAETSSGSDNVASDRDEDAGDAKTKDEVASEQESEPVQTLKKGSVMTGSQSEELLILGPNSSYKIKDKFIVSKGKTLEINEGVTMIFGAGSSIVVEGTLKVEGSVSAPVVFKSSSSGLSAWDGIKIFGHNGSVITYACFSGAKCAITLSKGGVDVSNSTFFRNEQAISTDGHYNPASTFTDCYFANNLRCATYHFAALNFVDCTIENNTEKGVWGDYYGDVCLQNCIVRKNGLGIRDGGYDGSAKAHGCIICDNREFDVECRSSKSGEFSGNYWGKATTAILKAKGDGAKLSKVKGNQVDVSDFLLAEPKDCGAKSYPKVR